MFVQVRAQIEEGNLDSLPEVRNITIEKWVLVLLATYEYILVYIPHTNKV